MCSSRGTPTPDAFSALSPCEGQAKTERVRSGCPDQCELLAIVPADSAQAGRLLGDFSQGGGTGIFRRGCGLWWPGRASTLESWHRHPPIERASPNSVDVASILQPRGTRGGSGGAPPHPYGRTPRSLQDRRRQPCRRFLQGNGVGSRPGRCGPPWWTLLFRCLAVVLTRRGPY